MRRAIRSKIVNSSGNRAAFVDVGLDSPDSSTMARAFTTTSSPRMLRVPMTTCDARTS